MEATGRTRMLNRTESWRSGPRSCWTVLVPYPSIAWASHVLGLNLVRIVRSFGGCAWNVLPESANDFGLAVDFASVSNLENPNLGLAQLVDNPVLPLTDSEPIASELLDSSRPWFGRSGADPFVDPHSDPLRLDLVRLPLGRGCPDNATPHLTVEAPPNREDAPNFWCARQPSARTPVPSVASMQCMRPVRLRSRTA